MAAALCPLPKDLSPKTPTSRGSWLQAGYTVPLIIAVTASSVSLSDSNSFRAIGGYAIGLCSTGWFELSPRPSLFFGRHSFPACRHPCVGRRIGYVLPVFQSPIPWPSPRGELGRLLQVIRHRFLSGSVFDVAVFALCCGPQSCSSSCTDLT